MMKVSHESPLHLLNKSLSYNDYDYCLPYLYERDITYRNFFQNPERVKKRFTILDCGLFEGEVPSNKYLVEIINEIKPDIFIVPDVWNDADLTCMNAQYWQKNILNQLPRKTQLMCVLQGEKLSEVINLFNKLNIIGFNHFAINHSGQFYLDIHNNPKLDVNYNKMLGRIEFIKKLQTLSAFNSRNYYHLLGMIDFSELHLIKHQEIDVSWINSIDSSNPIIKGLLKEEYLDSNIFYTGKPKSNVLEFYNSSITQEQHNIINNNLNKFKQICKSL